MNSNTQNHTNSASTLAHLNTITGVENFDEVEQDNVHKDTLRRTTYTGTNRRGAAPQGYMNMTQFKKAVGVSDHDTFKRLLVQFDIRPSSEMNVGFSKYSPQSVQKFLKMHGEMKMTAAKMPKSLLPEQSDFLKELGFEDELAKSIAGAQRQIKVTKNDLVQVRRLLTTIQTKYNQRFEEIEVALLRLIKKDLSASVSIDTSKL